MSDHAFSRRQVLGLIGCSSAAWPLTSRVTLASGQSDARLLVIILRGAMDGLDVIRPVGDPAFAALRPEATDGPRLDGRFALHPALADLMPLWNRKEFAAVHAVSTPYRDKRSHFDGQDMLEAGTGADIGPGGIRDGWMNRILQIRPDVSSETAFAIGREQMKILSGGAPVAEWAPETRLELSDATASLLRSIYATDPLFQSAADEAMMLAAKLDPSDLDGVRQSGRPDRPIAVFAADRLREDTRLAAFSISGWDTHQNQARSMDRMLGRLADTILVLKDRLGPVWQQTTILAMTEFGRTARMNGSRGTDHGTAGAMLLAGGAVNGGKVFGDWPGLDESDLYDRRDLMPTRDVRAYAAWALRHTQGLGRSELAGQVFPGLDLGDDPGIISA